MENEIKSSHRLWSAPASLEEEGFAEAVLLQAYQLLLVHGTGTEAGTIITQGGTFPSRAFGVEFTARANGLL